MSDAMEGKAVQALPKGQKAGQNLTLYGGRVMPQTFGQVIEYAQMMCKGGLAIPKHLRDNPGTCLRVIQQAMGWEMDPWAVASKTYSVNDVLAYEAQLIVAVIKKWAPIKEKVIPYKFEGQGDSLRCSITVHHAETGEEITYQSPPFKDIQPKNSPLWKTDPQQQLGYYTSRALTRRHFPEIILGVYDREEVMAMRDVTSAAERTVENYLHDDEPAEVVTGRAPVDKPASQIDRTAETVDEETGEIVEAAIPPEVIVANMVKSAKGFTSLAMLNEWVSEAQADIAALPDDARAQLVQAIDARRKELAEEL